MTTPVAPQEPMTREKLFEKWIKGPSTSLCAEFGGYAEYVREGWKEEYEDFLTDLTALINQECGKAKELQKEIDKREVYIGNGQSVRVSDNETHRYYINPEILDRLFEANSNITVGATGDWFFTAKELTKDKWEAIKKGEAYLLSSSGWSKFHAEVNGEDIDLTIEVPKQYSIIVGRECFFQGIDKLEFWFPGIYHKAVKKMNYEQICSLQKDINEVLERHIELLDPAVTLKVKEECGK